MKSYKKNIALALTIVLSLSVLVTGCGNSSKSADTKKYTNVKQVPKDTPTKDANGATLTDADKINVANAEQDIKDVNISLEHYLKDNFNMSVDNYSKLLDDVKPYVTDPLYKAFQEQAVPYVKKNNLKAQMIDYTVVETNFNKGTFQGKEVSGATINVTVQSQDVGTSIQNSGKKIESTREIHAIKISNKWIISDDKSLNKKVID